MLSPLAFFLIAPIPLAMSAVPVAMYLIMMGAIRLRRRPLVTTGWRDVASLGIAIMGLVAIGPIQLFFPTYAAARFSGWVWAMLLALYMLGLLLVVLSCRPRLIVYGLGEDAFFEALQDAALRVDAHANWQGQILTLPEVGLQLVTEPTGARSIQQVVSVSGLNSITHWMQLERELVKQCAGVVATQRGWAAAWLIAGGTLLIVWTTSMIMSDPAAALVELREFFAR